MTETYTEQDVKDCLDQLNSGVVPVSSGPVDDAISFLDTLSTAIDGVWADGRFGKDDFAALKPVWDQAWVLAEESDALEQEVQSFGLFKKVIYAVRTLLALAAVFKAMKQARANAKALQPAPAPAPPN